MAFFQKLQEKMKPTWRKEGDFRSPEWTSSETEGQKSSGNGHEKRQYNSNGKKRE